MSLTNDQILNSAVRAFEKRTAPNMLGAEAELLVHSYSIQTDWLSHPQTLDLTAVFLLSQLPSELPSTTQICGFVTDLAVEVKTRVKDPSQYFQELSTRYSAPVFDLKKPIQLTKVCVPKPWGQEIWYTGMEERGVSGVTAPGTKPSSLPSVTPLPWYLSIASDFIHKNKSIALLKILDPYAEPVKGDLYFELHTSKCEVYVVTQIDNSAWPEGKGRMRFGMNQVLRKAYPDDESFRAAYLNSVQHYRKLRTLIDNIPPGDSSPQYNQEEQASRAIMEGFSANIALSIGDTVVVQPDTPHSLLHGVRVIEFQTPVYERYIISFAQKVLTQRNWDSEKAIERMTLDTPETPVFDIIQNTQGVLAERIVAFDEFNVLRVKIEANGICHLKTGLPYAICIVIDGKVTLNGIDLHTEEACFIPRFACEDNIENHTDSVTTCLIAAPGL
ncbi:MAG: hypothetical protein KUG75_05615 [Pseudomonadales bacterium]|nr:hypothetical protein [Pseudomonadales bacterium]